MWPVVPVVQSSGRRGAFVRFAGAVNAEKNAAVTELTARITTLETDVAAAGEQLEQARAAEQEAAREASAALTRLAAAEARSVTLQQAHDALLARIVPETPAPE
jgi:chromosome segregation ATPase